MKDAIYRHVARGTAPLYQKYFEEILQKIDMQNLTNQTLSRPFDGEKAEKDLKLLERVANRALQKDDLHPTIIGVMVMQFVWADVYRREMDKDTWISRVMSRKKEDYFPDSWAVYEQFFSK